VKEEKNKKFESPKHESEPGGIIAFITSQRGVIVLVTCFALSLTMIYVLFTITKSLVIENYMDRASSTISVGALQFGEEYALLLENSEQWKNPMIENRLNTIKNTHPDIDDVKIVHSRDVGEYAASDKSFSTYILENEHKELRVTAYSPILNSAENVELLLAIEVHVENFEDIVKEKFMPFAISALCLSFLITILVMVLAGTLEKSIGLKHEVERQKHEIMSIVSHQLATPVSSMKWYTEMLLDGDVGELTDEQKEHVKTIESVSNNLADTVGLLLDASRLRAGSIHAKRNPINLDDFFKEVMHVMDPKAQEKGIEFIKNVQPELPNTRLDKRLMRMTIMNLLSNAIKYTPKGSKVTLTAEVSGNALKYSVKDEGCGVPKSEHHLMFSQLFRASNVSNKVHGNGLGLYVAKGAVEELGGKIKFSNKVNEGTEFRVEIPLER
jgi:signal transduction histidine kinase|tara:strand:- start:1962 stop:3284 length:1323 start_codon:yes stop_codon:yes gene_type:complete